MDVQLRSKRLESSSFGVVFDPSLNIVIRAKAPTFLEMNTEVRFLSR